MKYKANKFISEFVIVYIYQLCNNRFVTEINECKGGLVYEDLKDFVWKICLLLEYTFSSTV
jgi:hypothetical protein